MNVIPGDVLLEVYKALLRVKNDRSVAMERRNEAARAAGRLEVYLENVGLILEARAA